MKTIATHNGIFHADEISAIALLEIFTDEHYQVERVPHQTKKFEKYDYVIDISLTFDGEKFFDHHQYKGGKSSAGLIWEYIGKEKEYPTISKLVKIIDEQDTGVARAGEFEFPNLIKAYNAKDIYSQKQQEQFYKAISFAKEIFSSLKQKDEAVKKAKKIVANANFFNGNHQILELSEYTPFWGTYVNAEEMPEVKAVVWEDKDQNNYKIQIAPKKRGSLKLNAKPLTPSDTMEFVHKAGFFGVAKDRSSLEEYLEKIRL